MKYQKLLSVSEVTIVVRKKFVVVHFWHQSIYVATDCQLKLQTFLPGLAFAMFDTF